MTQYLILHKVRGEPAFDIAEKLRIGDEEGWIIPTSGHRAYPYVIWTLAELVDTNLKTIPDDWPDHYQPIDLPAKKGMGLPINISEILGNLMPKIRRRI